MATSVRPAAPRRILGIGRIDFACRVREPGAIDVAFGARWTPLLRFQAEPAGSSARICTATKTRAGQANVLAWAAIVLSVIAGRAVVFELHKNAVTVRAAIAGANIAVRLAEIPIGGVVRHTIACQVASVRS